MYERFMQLLQENDITAYRVSKDTGVTQTTLSDWKTGRATPRTTTLKKIADYFNVSVDWLTGESVFRNNTEIGRYYSDWGISDIYFEPPFDFCPLLESLRVEQGISIEDMAHVIGATAEQYQECESGILPITYEQAEKLCKFLNTNVSQVLFDNNHYDDEVPEEYHDDVHTWELLKEFSENEAAKESALARKSIYDQDENLVILNRNAKKLSPEKRKQLLDMARLMFKEEFDD